MKNRILKDFLAYNIFELIMGKGDTPLLHYDTSLLVKYQLKFDLSNVVYSSVFPRNTNNNKICYIYRV